MKKACKRISDDFELNSSFLHLSLNKIFIHLCHVFSVSVFSFIMSKKVKINNYRSNMFQGFQLNSTHQTIDRLYSQTVEALRAKELSDPDLPFLDEARSVLLDAGNAKKVSNILLLVPYLQTSIFLIFCSKSVCE